MVFRSAILALSTLAAFAFSSCGQANEWSRFRGPEGRGIASLDQAPTSWTANDYEWVIKLPGVGHSSPAVREGRLYLTAGTDGGERITLCLDAATGKEIWSKSIKMAPSHLHKKNSYGSGTPAVGDEGVFVLFADTENHIAVGFDHDGNEMWRRDLGSFTSQHGQGSSAIIYEGMVIVPNDQMGTSSVAALDAKSGDVVWQTEKTVRKTAYATPLVASIDGHDVLLTLSGAEGVAGFDPKSGRKLFASGEVPLRVVASPIIADGAIIVSCGSGGVGKHMEAVVAKKDGSNWTAQTRWIRKKLLPYVPTPIVHDGALFLWNDGGTVACVDPATGDDIWKQRVGGNYSGSPVLIAGRLYVISEDGEIKVVDAAREFNEHPGGKIDDYSYATPAVADGRIYFRGFSSLSCLNTASVK